MSDEKKFQSKRWFNAVRNAAGDSDDIAENLGTLAEVIEQAHAYWLEACDDARPHCTAFGELNTMLAEQPGLVHFYTEIFNDAMTTRRWLEQEHDSQLAAKYKWLTSDAEAKAEFGKLGATDAKNYASSDDTVWALAEMVRVLSNAQHALEAVTASLTQRGMSLAKIADIRARGGEEIWIQPSRR